MLSAIHLQGLMVWLVVAALGAIPYQKLSQSPKCQVLSNPAQLPQNPGLLLDSMLLAPAALLSKLNSTEFELMVTIGTAAEVTNSGLGSRRQPLADFLAHPAESAHVGFDPEILYTSGVSEALSQNLPAVFTGQGWESQHHILTISGHESGLGFHRVTSPNCKLWADSCDLCSAR